MDLQKLGRGEQIAGVSAVLLFIFMFFDWFSASISGGGGISGSIGSGNAWDVLNNIPVFLVITILIALAVAALRLMDSNYKAPISPNAVVALFGAISFLLILYRIIDTPGGGSGGGISVNVSPTFGIFISLIAAAGITYGGYLGMNEEGTTLGDIADRFGSGSGRASTPRSSTPTPPPRPSGEAPSAPPPQPGPDEPPPPPPAG